MGIEGIENLQPDPAATQPVDSPAPDPGNSPPEKWTEPMAEDEVREVAQKLEEESHTETEFEPEES